MQVIYDQLRSVPGFSADQLEQIRFSIANSIRGISALLEDCDVRFDLVIVPGDSIAVAFSHNQSDLEETLVCYAIQNGEVLVWKHGLIGGDGKYQKI